MPIESGQGGEYTVRFYFERLGSEIDEWMQKDLSVYIPEGLHKNSIKELLEERASEWRGVIEGSNPGRLNMYGDVARIKVISIT